MSTRAQSAGRGRGSASVPRRRPAARRNPGSASSRIKWDRLGRIALVLVIVGLAISYVGPLINLAKTYRQAGVSKADLHIIQAEHAQLERRVKHVQSDAVLRREARRQGMVEPSEQAYVVNGISQ